MVKEGQSIMHLQLRHVVAKKRNCAHGHIIIYEIDEAAKAVNILHLFHTRQDYQGRLGDQS